MRVDSGANAISQRSASFSCGKGLYAPATGWIMLIGQARLLYHEKALFWLQAVEHSPGLQQRIPDAAQHQRPGEHALAERLKGLLFQQRVRVCGLDVNPLQVAQEEGSPGEVRRNAHPEEGTGMYQQRNHCDQEQQARQLPKTGEDPQANATAQRRLFVAYLAANSREPEAPPAHKIPYATTRLPRPL